MRKLQLICLILFLLAYSNLQASEWQKKLKSLLVQDDLQKIETLAPMLTEAKPPLLQVLDVMREKPDSKPDYGHHLRMSMCLDGIERPYCLFVPNRKELGSAPLFVYLHGAVTRSEIRKEPLAYAKNAPFLSLCKERGWFHLTPFGQKGAAWWDKVGMANIMSQIALIKSQYDIDDNRVYLGGFSDGGSAAFCLAMVKPSVFASFIALNGHIGVGSLDGDLSTFVQNMSQTPVYAVTTNKDGLYPTKVMAPTLDLAQRFGARLTYRMLPGTHTFDYSTTEIPRISRFMDSSVRNPNPGAIDWEAASADYGRCHWLQILELAPFSKRKSWHHDANISLVSDRITIGFHEDSEFKGEGDRVKSLAKGHTVARLIGLQVGDVITAGGKMAIKSGKDLAAYKKTLKRGSPIELTVLRENKTLVLRGTIPPPEYYYLFKRQRPSGRVKARVQGNRFILETSRTAKVRLLLNSDQIEPGSLVEVYADDKKIHSVETEIDYDFLLRDFLQRRDRKNIYYGFIDVEI